METESIGIVGQIIGLPWKDILVGVSAVLGAASVIAKLTPTKTDDKIIAAILKVVHVFGLTKSNVSSPTVK